MIQKIEPHNQQQSTGGMSGGVFMLCNKTASRDRAKYLPGGRYGCVFGQPCWLTVSAWFTSSDELNGKWSIRFFLCWLCYEFESLNVKQAFSKYWFRVGKYNLDLMLLPADNLISFIRNISNIYVTKVQSFLNVIFVGTQLAVYLDKMFFFHELVLCY